MAQTYPSPVVIEGNIDREEVTTTENLLVTIHLTNTEELPIDGLDVQVISPGLTIISEKRWPDNIHPNSSLVGQYVLQASRDGTFPISATATYTLNNTLVRPPLIRDMVSQLELDDVVVKSAPFLSQSTVWAGAPTTVLGTVIGFVITKLTDYFTSKRMEERDRKTKRQLAKSLVLTLLEVNQKRIEKDAPLDLGPWDEIEKLYYFIPEVLRNRIRDFYVDLDSFSRARGDATLKNSLNTSIEELLKNIKIGWIT